MKVIVVYKLLVFISEWERPTWPPYIQMAVTAGIFLASVLLKEMLYLVYIRYLFTAPSKRRISSILDLCLTC